MRVTDYLSDPRTYEFVRGIVGGTVANAAAAEGDADAEQVAIRAALASAAFLARAVAGLPASAAGYGLIEWQMAGHLASLLSQMVAAERAERAILN